MNWQIQRFASVDSTMHTAASLPVASVVVADEQHAGIGRHGHAWDSRARAGLYMSAVLPPHPALTLALGLAAHAAIRTVTSLQCDIRWPNDLMLGDRNLGEKKFGGILVQLHDTRAVAGIGINIGQRSFPPDLANIATSLWIETGLEFHRDDILDALLSSIPSVTALSVSEIIGSWTSISSWANGKSVQVDLGNRTITGVTDGLDAAGFLRVRKPGGDTELILAGGVRPL